MLKTMSVVVIIVIGALIVFFGIKQLLKGDNNNTSRPPESAFPTIKKSNDKIILVENISSDNINKALVALCNMYNQQSYSTLPRLWELGNNRFAVTFPYDIDFPGFCFTVNYLQYPTDISPRPNARGWLTTNAHDEWITDKSAGKVVMIYLADNDTEFDNVFLTTDDNVGYKLGFAAGKEQQLLTSPEKPFVYRPFSIDDLSGKTFKDFR